MALTPRHMEYSFSDGVGLASHVEAPYSSSGETKYITTTSNRLPHKSISIKILQHAHYLVHNEADRAFLNQSLWLEG